MIRKTLILYVVLASLSLPASGQGTWTATPRRVGIGTKPEGQLHVVSTSTIDPFLFATSHSVTGFGLVVSTSGSVGVGTTAPANKLHIQGTAGAAAGIYLNNAAPLANTATLYNSGGNLYWSGTSLTGGGALPSASEGYTLRGNGASWQATGSLYIKSDGSVGIGTTNPAAILHLYKSSADIFQYFETAGTGNDVYTYLKNPGTSWTYGLTGANSNFTIARAAGLGGTNAHLNITTGGNIGIGTTAPLATLDVYSGASNAGLKSYSANGDATHLFINPYYDTTDSNRRIVDIGVVGNGISAMRFLGQTDSGGSVDTIMYLKSGGNVGIGTTNPGSRLEVNGTLSVANAATFANTATFASTATFNKAGAINSAPNLFSAGSNVIAAIFGSGSATGFTADQYGGAIRFNGANVLWGDLSFYPTGTTDKGNFRFSTTGGDLSSTPSGKLGVGALYSVGSIGIGTASPGHRLHVIGDNSLPTNGYSGEGVIRIEGTNAAVLDIGQNSDTAPWGGWLQAYDNRSGYLTTYYPIVINPLGGNVGIGTTGPGANLSVAGTLGVSETGATGNRLQITSTSAGAVVFQNDNSPIIFKTQTATQEKMRITDGGNVGIGTAGPAAKLDIATSSEWGTASVAALNLSNTGTEGNIYSTHGLGAVSWGTNGGVRTASIEAVREQPAGGNPSALVFRAGSTGGGSEYMRVSSGGNVGIGTTNPGAKLSVNTAINTSSVGAIEIQQATNGANKAAALIGLSIQNGGESTNAADMWFQTASGGSLVEGMRITSSGNVGIRNTAPSYILDVGDYHIGPNTLNTFRLIGRYTGADGAFANLRLSQTAEAGGSWFGIVARRESNNYGVSTDFTVNNTGAGATPLTVLTLQYNGNVGIGTTSPHTTLTVGSSDAGAFITPGGNNTHLSLQTVGESGAVRFYTIGGTTNNVAPTESMRIAAGGNVGIGTTNPSHTLEVNGSVHAAGNITWVTGIVTGQNMNSITQNGYYIGYNVINGVTNAWAVYLVISNNSDQVYQKATRAAYDQGASTERWSSDGGVNWSNWVTPH